MWVLRDFTSRGIWPIGRVEAAFLGRDGQTRVCSVKPAYGTLEHPRLPFMRRFRPVTVRSPRFFFGEISRTAFVSPLFSLQLWGLEHVNDDSQH